MAAIDFTLKPSDLYLDLVQAYDFTDWERMVRELAGNLPSSKP